MCPTARHFPVRDVNRVLVLAEGAGGRAGRRVAPGAAPIARRRIGGRRNATSV